jgi:hypothetical protein
MPRLKSPAAEKKKVGRRPIHTSPPPAVPGNFRYGRDWGDRSDLAIELACFLAGLEPAQGGLGKSEHFWNIVSVLWPATSRKPFIRNPWGERMIEEWCKYNFSSVSGCASSSKTDTAAVWGIVNWLAAPLDTKVLCTSTTLRESRKRIWGSIEDYWSALPDEVRALGKLASSFGLIRLSEASGVKASEKCGIELIPGEKKREKEATGKIIGIKNKRVILIADELPELSPAIMQAAVSNLTANPYCQAIGLGNPASYYDAHGIFSTPKAGWKSITPNDFEWETIYGHAVRFDATLSPNVVNDDDTLFPWLPTKARLEEAKRNMGEDSFGFWRQWRGFFPPEGGEKTVFSDTDIVFFNADRTDVNWAEPPIPVVGMDPGFTNEGDRTIAYFGLFGEEADTGLSVLHLTGYEVVKEDMTNKTVPRNFQIAQAYRSLSEKRGVIPKHAACDVSGSPAFGDIVARVWSGDVYRGQFGGKSTMNRVGEDRAMAKERYANRATELWFEARNYMESGQIRGVCPDLARELTGRRYTTGATAGSLDATVAIEPKRKMKARSGVSPDIADAFLMLFDLCRSRLGFRAQAGRATAQRKSESWNNFRKKKLKLSGGNRPKFNMKSLIYDRGAPKIFVGRAKNLNFVR